MNLALYIPLTPNVFVVGWLVKAKREIASLPLLFWWPITPKACSAHSEVNTGTVEQWNRQSLCGRAACKRIIFQFTLITKPQWTDPALSAGENENWVFPWTLLFCQTFVWSLPEETPVCMSWETEWNAVSLRQLLVEEYCFVLFGQLVGWLKHMAVGRKARKTSPPPSATNPKASPAWLMACHVSTGNHSWPKSSSLHCRDQWVASREHLLLDSKSDLLLAPY